MERVEDGSRLVSQAGETMTEIVSSVRRVSGIIEEITAASSEQSDNVAQISQSVSQLDNMTQQNAALVEESTAASESLREQAVQLTRAVAQFKLPAEGMRLSRHEDDGYSHDAPGLAGARQCPDWPDPGPRVGAVCQAGASPERWGALTCCGAQSLVTRSTSSRLVMPAAISRSPSSRISVMPAARAAVRISASDAWAWICARMASSVTSNSNTLVRPCVACVPAGLAALCRGSCRSIWHQPLGQHAQQ